MITFEHRRMKQLLPQSPSWDQSQDCPKSRGFVRDQKHRYALQGYFKTLEHMAKYEIFLGIVEKTKLSWNGIGRDSNEELERLASGG